MNLPTPCVVIDLNVVDRNIERMAKIAQQSGVALRPHSKTHKIPSLAKIQIGKGAKGITVAKVSEAEVMASNGINDIFIAYPIIGEQKIRRVLELSKQVKVIVGVDSLEGATALARAARLAKQTIEVRLEVDTGAKRTGVQYAKALNFAKDINQMAGLKLVGIYTYRGLVFQRKPTMNREKAGLEEGQLMVSLAERLNKSGIKIKDVSVGSTPTAEFAAKVSGITEIRPGEYIFNDMAGVFSKACSISDCAAKVFTTVVSVPSEKHAIIDGGSKTFGTDIHPNTFPYYFKGYGRIVGFDNLVLDNLNEEHGIICTTSSKSAQQLKVGQVLKIIPNHICTTVNLHNTVFFTRGDILLDEVIVEGRGKVF